MGSASPGSPTTRGSRTSAEGTSRSGSSSDRYRLRRAVEGATQRGALPRGGPHSQGAAQGAQAVGHALQSGAVGRDGRIEPRTVVLHFECELSVLLAQPNRG